MSEDDEFPLPFEVGVKGIAKYEHSNIKKHLILEFRSDEFTICKPKIIPHKPHWYSAEQKWIVHYKDVDEPDIKLLDKDEVG